MFCAFRLLKNQVTGKLNYAHVGMYFIYRGAVSGSRGLMSLWLTASLMSLDMLPVNESFTPNRFLNDAFVSHPTEYTLDRHAKLERQLAWMTLRIRQRMDWHIAERGVFWKKAAQTVLERLVIEHTETADSWVNVKIRDCYNLIVQIYIILR